MNKYTKTAHNMLWRQGVTTALCLATLAIMAYSYTRPTTTQCKSEILTLDSVIHVRHIDGSDVPMHLAEFAQEAIERNWAVNMLDEGRDNE